jgi:dCMP deaminase
MDYSTWASGTITAVNERLDAVSKEGNCLKRQVGAAILAESGSILAVAANGTPSGMPRCDSGGCVRCAVSTPVARIGYDLCICLHAEQAVLIAALTYGIEVKGRFLATSYQPCLMCAKLIVAARLRGVLYAEPWRVPEEEYQLPGLRADYTLLWKQLPGGCQPLKSLTI